MADRIQHGSAFQDKFEAFARRQNAQRKTKKRTVAGFAEHKTLSEQDVRRLAEEQIRKMKQSQAGDTNYVSFAEV